MKLSSIHEAGPPRNPYAIAAARADAATRELRPPVVNQPAAMPERIGAFFSAMEIGHGGNKAKVLTAIAHTMTPAERAETIRRLLADRQEQIAVLTQHDAPEVLFRYANKKHADIIRILERAGAS